MGIVIKGFAMKYGKMPLLLMVVILFYSSLLLLPVVGLATERIVAHMWGGMIVIIRFLLRVSHGQN